MFKKNSDIKYRLIILLLIILQKLVFINICSWDTVLKKSEIKYSVKAYNVITDNSVKVSIVQ